MRFYSRQIQIEANQFLKRGECPLGVYTRENGEHYVITIQGEQVNVHEGDWIILENPPGDGTRAYPCEREVFERRYMKA
jgi:hypothetical protein